MKTCMNNICMKNICMKNMLYGKHLFLIQHYIGLRVDPIGLPLDCLLCHSALRHSATVSFRHECRDGLAHLAWVGKAGKHKAGKQQGGTAWLIWLGSESTRLEQQAMQ